MATITPTVATTKKEPAWSHTMAYCKGSFELYKNSNKGKPTKEVLQSPQASTKQPSVALFHLKILVITLKNKILNPKTIHAIAASQISETENSNFGI